jgi:hypothetical protein
VKSRTEVAIDVGFVLVRTDSMVLIRVDSYYILSVSQLGI